MDKQDLWKLSISDLYAIIDYCGDTNTSEIRLCRLVEEVLREKFFLPKKD